jgi:NAD(P)H-hydrate epimerase
LGCSTQEVQEDRGLALKRLYEKWGGVIVLKGAGTLIMAPETPPHICPVSNPVMATAGMGDVLSGMIVGLMAQQLSPFEAAALATIVHAEAAEQACVGTRGLLASDLFKEIPLLLNSKIA